MTINLKLSVPTKVLMQQPVSKILADGAHGSFCILPRHIDCLAALVPGILVLTDPAGHELFFANDHGLLIKRGPEVLISARRAIQGNDLGSLRKTVHDQFERLDESDRVCHSAIASLEASFLRRFLDMQQGLA